MGLGLCRQDRELFGGSGLHQESRKRVKITTYVSRAPDRHGLIPRAVGNHDYKRRSTEQPLGLPRKFLARGASFGMLT